MAGAFLSFLLVKSNFQMQEWNIRRKVMDSAVTEPPEAALTEERRIPHSIFPSPLAPVYKHINSCWMIKSPVFLLLFFFYSALQALCLMFPIASPEINQSNTCSRPLGRWRRPSTLLAVPRTDSCATLVKSQLYDLGTPASFKQAISEEGDKKLR